jgi:hypothetical protein
VVNVGVTHDTAEFAVESICRWWKLDGRKTYPAARRLLICADAGGSNGNRLRLWKLNLQQLADQIQLPITVCHYPPGTSKWNKIEHRLFSFISLNWKRQPPSNYETIINLIGGAKTRTGSKSKPCWTRMTTRSESKSLTKNSKMYGFAGTKFTPLGTIQYRPASASDLVQ